MCGWAARSRPASPSAVSFAAVSDRDLDVVVFGATGVTGRQVAAYLAERSAGTELRWAVAGRSAERLSETLGELGVQAPERIAADVADPSSLAAMASRARVVLNLVGPYTLYGRPVIEACIAGGAHYADLTGEMPFVRRIVNDLDGRATEAGVKIVQVCGFEALPPDLAVLLAAECARERWGEELETVDLEVTFIPPPGRPRLSDGISGGTFQSMSAVTADDDAALIADPAVLITDPALAAEVRRVSPIAIAPRRGADGAVIAPIMPAPFINPAVIQRTAGLIASSEGRTAHPFRYREGMALAGGAASLPARLAVAGALSATQAGLRRLARVRSTVRTPIAAAFGRVVPSSGFGPAAHRLEAWRWTMAVHARTAGEHRLEVSVDAHGHPGYLATARLLGEAGMLLAEPGLTPDRAGCLTPASALGTASLPRFEHARMRIAVSD
jgi:short subunit dehydrogenase-like uncharacterized protein